MSLTSEDIGAIVAAFESSDWTELSLQLGETRLDLSRSGTPPLGATPATVPASTPAARPAPAAGPTPPDTATPTGSSPEPAPAPTPTVASTHSEVTAGTVEVLAPTIGLFWRSPQPGAPPFVEVGQRVEPDDTVCIVEVMKLMSHVKAGTAGTVMSVPVENGAMVEHGDILLVIEPAG